MNENPNYERGKIVHLSYIPDCFLQIQEAAEIARMYFSGIRQLTRQLPVEHIEQPHQVSLTSNNEIIHIYES